MSFDCFQASQRCEAIEEFLEEEIDLDYFVDQGIILDHFHLHKRTTVEDIQDSFKHYYWKLLYAFLGFDDSFIKYMQPLNMMKMYYGEKVAFEYAYLIHYNAWLFIATVGGLALFAYQIYWWNTGPQGFTWLYSDTQYNGIYCVFIIIWATLFVESWKRVQA